MNKIKAFEFEARHLTYYVLASDKDEALQILISVYGESLDDIECNSGKSTSINELEEDDVVYTEDGEPVSVMRAIEEENCSMFYGYLS